MQDGSEFLEDDEEVDPSWLDKKLAKGVLIGASILLVGIFVATV